ncbi:MAG: hypothetical protein HKN47_21025 [Pirellulaceae bacterium]|nr:hypothetical protein [Pirellulaceae bacterium]
MLRPLVASMNPRSNLDSRQVTHRSRIADRPLWTGHDRIGFRSMGAVGGGLALPCDLAARGHKITLLETND